MIELFAVASPNVYKVGIMLEECRLDYTLTYVDVFAQQQFGEDFRRVSPACKVPAIIDRDGPGGQEIRLAESGAILIYMAEKTGMLMPADPAGRAEVMQWMMIQMASVGPMFGQYLHFLLFAKGEAAQYGQARYEAQVRHLLAIYDQALSARSYVAGDAYSIADIAVLPWVYRATELFPWLAGGEQATLADLYPSLAKWLATAMDREGSQRGRASIDRLLTDTDTSFGAASRDGLDRFFLRA